MRLVPAGPEFSELSELSEFNKLREPSPYLVPPRPSVLWLVVIAAAHVGAVAWLYSTGRITAPTTPTALMVRIIAPVQKVATEQVAAPAPTAPTAPPITRPPPPAKQPRARRPAAPPPVTAPPTQSLVTQNEGAESSVASSLPIREMLPAPAQAAEPATAPAAPAAPAVTTQARFDADYLQNPAPIYPALSRRLSEEGRVVLRVFVSPDGLPEQIELRTGSGSPRLDQAARDAVRRWRFIPARRGDEAIGAWVQVPIVFKLRD